MSTIKISQEYTFLVLRISSRPCMVGHNFGRGLFWSPLPVAIINGAQRSRSGSVVSGRPDRWKAVNPSAVKPLLLLLLLCCPIAFVVAVTSVRACS